MNNEHQTAFCTTCKKVTTQLDNTAFFVCCECGTQNSLLNHDGTANPHVRQGAFIYELKGIK